ELMNQVVPGSFVEGCQLLKNKFDSQVEHIQIDFFHGLNKRAFKTYISSNDIEKVYIPEGANHKKATKRSFDLVPYIKKVCDNVSHVQFEEKNEDSIESFSELFLNTIKL